MARICIDDDEDPCDPDAFINAEGDVCITFDAQGEDGPYAILNIIEAKKLQTRIANAIAEGIDRLNGKGSQS